MPKGYSKDRTDVLIALYGYFLTEDAGPQVSVFDFKRRASLLLSASYISLLLASLEREDYVESDLGDHNTDVYTLTDAGVLRAEKEVLDRGMTLDEFEIEFRKRYNSGLIVSTDHPEIEAAQQALRELQDHLRHDNDLGQISGEERDSAVEEIAELQRTLEKPKVRTSYLWSKANEVLMWIIEKGAGAAVGEIAKTALRHIHAFINVFFS
jgi:hypothetical protein